MPYRWQVITLAVLAAFALACEGAGNAGPAPSGGPAPKPGRPSSMAALGDSISCSYVKPLPEASPARLLVDLSGG